MLYPTLLRVEGMQAQPPRAPRLHQPTAIAVDGGKGQGWTSGQMGKASQAIDP